MRKWALLCAFIVVSFSAGGQQTLVPLTERIEVSVINVDVTVTDRAGHPVNGLSRDDFEVFEDGRAQRITNFYTIENAAVRITRGDTSGAEDAGDLEQFRRKVVLMIDNNFIVKPQRDAALTRLDDFIDNHFADTTDVDSASLSLALGTGGLYLTSSDTGQNFEQIDTDTSNYYSLGYSPQHSGDGKYHHISVKVKKPGLAVRHRDGYLDLSFEQRLEQSLLSPLTFPKEEGSLPVALVLGLPVDAERVRVPVTAAVAMSRLTVLPRCRSRSRHRPAT